jgi:hypothetical protein
MDLMIGKTMLGLDHLQASIVVLPPGRGNRERDQYEVGRARRLDHPRFIQVGDVHSDCPRMQRAKKSVWGKA